MHAVNLNKRIMRDLNRGDINGPISDMSTSSSVGKLLRSLSNQRDCSRPCASAIAETSCCKACRYCDKMYLREEARCLPANGSRCQRSR